MVRLLNVYFPTRAVCLFLAEASLIFACIVATIWAVYRQDTYLALNLEYGYVKASALTIALLAILYYFNLYEPDLLFERNEIYFRIVLALGLLSLMLAGLLRLFPVLTLIGPALPWLLVALGVLLCFWRRVYAWLATRALFRERVYVLGHGPRAECICDVLKRRKDLGMDAMNDELPDTESSQEITQRLMYLDRPINRLLIAVDDRRKELPMQNLLDLKFKGVIIEDVSEMIERLSGKIPLDGLRHSAFIYSDGFRIKPSQQFTRRVLSMLVAILGLLSFAPFFPIVALLVKLSSPGPIFFSQIRVGEGGRTFRVYKFRTMRTDAEASGAKFAAKNDPRATRVGLFMRKTRIDEIPQLWNVLRGEMAFVGPRPERPEFIPWLTEQLPFYTLRHIVRPGLTGWAQIRYGYGATLEENREKLSYDLYYVKHASLGLDLLIMFETIKIILHRRGAQ